jgi:cell division septation protein DedD
MASQEEYEQQIRILQAYRQTLAHLLEQAAKHGGISYSPPAVANGIRDARQEVATIKRVIRGWGYSVADNPMDGDQVDVPVHAQSTSESIPVRPKPPKPPMPRFVEDDNPVTVNQINTSPAQPPNKIAAERQAPLENRIFYASAASAGVITLLVMQLSFMSGWWLIGVFLVAYLVLYVVMYLIEIANGRL